MQLILPTTEDESMEFKEWVAEKHGQSADVFPSWSYGYGVTNGSGEIIFGVVLEAFHSKSDILGHLYGDNPRVFFNTALVKKMMAVPFTHPFNARRATLMIHSKRRRIIRTAKLMGFEEEGIMKDHFEDDDAVVLRCLAPVVGG